MSLIHILISLALILVLSGSASSRWCTRLKSEKHVQTFIEYAQCNQSYQAACGWFTRQQCTFYELVDCPKERNHTIVKYKIVEECCPGYDLDPINNITCIRKAESHLGKEEVTNSNFHVTLADLSPLGIATESNATKNMSDGGHEGSVHVYESDDGLFLGLSHGAYAGIICSFLFVTCVLILIILHVVKRKRRLKADNQGAEVEMSEKMIPTVQT